MAVWHVMGAETLLASAKWQSVASRLRELRVSFQCHSSRSVEDLQPAIDRAIDDGATHFVSVGGDGSASLLVDGLLQRSWNEPPVVGLIPLGTGCDFARHFNVPLDPMEAAGRLRYEPDQNEPDQNDLDQSNLKQNDREQNESHSLGQLCDVGVMEGSWGTRHFLNVASIGLTAAAARRAAPLRWLGTARYLFGFWTTLPTFPTRTFELSINGTTISHRGVQAVVANGRYFGSGFPVAPVASSNDGMLDVLMVTATRLQIPGIFQKVRSGDHIHDANVICSLGNDLEIRCETPTPIEVDGDYLGDTPVRFRAIPNAIRIKC